MVFYRTVWYGMCEYEWVCMRLYEYVWVCMIYVWFMYVIYLRTNILTNDMNPAVMPPWRSTAKLSKYLGLWHLAGKRRPRSAPPPLQMKFQATLIGKNWFSSQIMILWYNTLYRMILSIITVSLASSSYVFWKLHVCPNQAGLTRHSISTNGCSLAANQALEVGWRPP